MISKEKISEIIRENVEEDGYFIVDIDIKPSNKIKVQIDGDNGIPIEYCIKTSRLIEQNLDRETEDFELEVSSPGIGQPFKILKQYQKCIGRNVEIITQQNEKVKGTLISASEKEVLIKQEKLIKPAGKKKKELQVTEHAYTFDDIKSTKEIIKF